MNSMHSILLGATALGASAFVAVSVFAPGAAAAKHAATGNPFAHPSPLFLQAPQFDKIHDTDYAPAFDQGMKEQLAEIDAIANDKAAPTFNNTVIAIEKSG